MSREAREQAKLTQQLAGALQSTKAPAVAPTPAATPAAPAALHSGATLTRAEYAALDARLAAIESALGTASAVRSL